MIYSQYIMFKDTKAFSGFSVNDIAVAKKFYGETLGINIEDGPMQGVLQLKIAGGNTIFVYEKPDHTPATFTILNFQVDNIEKTVSELKEKGITFEQYKDMTDEDGIARGKEHNMGPNIAWFKDPAGNFLSVIEE